jgi:hypothetical protein
MTTDAMNALTDQALEAAGFADMRPEYRTMLRKLKQRDATGFAEATRRYEEVLAPAVAGGDADLVAAWVEYGAWLARRLGPGRLVRLDASGLAMDAGPEPVPDHVILYLPEEVSDPAIALLEPVVSSAAQKAALELLAR